MIRRERSSSSPDPYWSLNADGRKLVNREASKRYNALRIQASILFYGRMSSPSPQDMHNFEQFLEHNKYRIRREESTRLLQYSAYMWEKKHGRKNTQTPSGEFEEVKRNKYRPLKMRRGE